MEFTFDNNIPIYIQLLEYIKTLFRSVKPKNVYLHDEETESKLNELEALSKAISGQCDKF